jgi:RNA polymerase sigma-54 factor
MAISPRLEIRQSQTLVMTPQLQQAIKLLQLSNIELSAYVEQEMERNPLLERTETEGSAEAEANRDAGEEVRASEIDQSAAADTKAREALDTDYENAYTNDAASDGPPELGPGQDQLYSNRAGNLRFDNPDFSLEQTLSGEIGLRDHLLGQLHVDITDPVDRAIGMHLIDLVDEAGYITEDLAEVAARLGCETAHVEKVLTRLQTFDPVGVCARNLKECLGLQLRERDRLDPAMQTMLDNLELLARRELGQLMRLCGVDAEDITDMLAEIRALNPKPGLAFGSEVTQTVVPDVFVRQNADGGWLVELNSDTLPRVLVNTRYYARISGTTKNKTDKAYMSECLNSANWLVKSLDQRANTILKVATELVRQQDAFFAKGVQHLRPLNLRAIAEAISMHESTVSRVTANKYMATPRGIFEMKYFFTSAIQSSAGGEAHSAEAVRHRIRELIDAEPPDGVLSDDRIVEILLESGVDIARRTVAKYREAMHIPSSVQRRRLKKLPA